MVDGHIHSNVLIKDHLRICELLPQCDVFKDIKVSVLNNLAHQIQKIPFKAGETIMRQGDIGDSFYLINEGTAGVTVEKDGVSKEVSELHHGEWFGELALLNDEPRLATVFAKTDIETYALAKENFLEVIKNPPDLGEEIRNLYMQAG